MLVAAAVAFAGSLVELCARAAMVDAVGRRSRRRRRSRGAGAGGGFPSLSAPPSLDRVRVWMVGTVVAAGEPRDQCRSPHLLYIYTARRGPTSHLLGWASPIRTRVKGPVRRWANWWRSILTFSPLISPYTFKLLDLNLTLYFSLLALLSILISLQIGT